MYIFTIRPSKTKLYLDSYCKLIVFEIFLSLKSSLESIIYILFYISVLNEEWSLIQGKLMLLKYTYNQFIKMSVIYLFENNYTWNEMGLQQQISVN